MPKLPASPRPGVADVVAFMRKRRITMVDLIETDHRSAPADKCRAVERCWELLARLGLKFVDLEDVGLQFEDKIPSLEIVKQIQRVNPGSIWTESGALAGNDCERNQ